MKSFRVSWHPIGEPDRAVTQEVGATDWCEARVSFCNTSHEYHGRRITLEPHDTRIYAIEVALLGLPIRAPKPEPKKKPRKDKPHGHRKDDE